MLCKITFLNQIANVILQLKEVCLFLKSKDLVIHKMKCKGKRALVLLIAGLLRYEGR